MRRITRSPKQMHEWIVRLIAAGDLRPFYHSSQWRHLRAQVLRESHYECQQCKAEGKVTTSEDMEIEGRRDLTVHHIIPVRQRPDLALDRDNLEVLCDEHHWLVHHPEEKRTNQFDKWDDERW